MFQLPACYRPVLLWCSGIHDCTFARCDWGWTDLDGAAANGCEAACWNGNSMGVCTPSHACHGAQCNDGDPETVRDRCTATGVCKGTHTSCYEAGSGASSCALGLRCRDMACDDGKDSTYGDVCSGNNSTACMRKPCADKALAYATCSTCTTTSTNEPHCLTLTCTDNRFDTDGKARNGCEAGCTADLPHAACDTCANATAAGCLTLTCADNHFDTDGKTGNGCEAGCTTDLPYATCITCTDATAAGCLAMTNCGGNDNNSCECKGLDVDWSFFERTRTADVFPHIPCECKICDGETQPLHKPPRAQLASLPDSAQLPLCFTPVSVEAQAAEASPRPTFSSPCCDLCPGFDSPGYKDQTQRKGRGSPTHSDCFEMPLGPKFLGSASIGIQGAQLVPCT